MVAVQKTAITKQTFTLLLIAIFLGACGLNQGEVNVCPPPPDGFSEADLVGAWTGGYVTPPKQTDTLIIREDGTYKQIIHMDVPAFDYESDWQAWRLEYAENGLPYLHLEGMRLCAYGGGEIIGCDQVGGGDNNYWYDFCQDDWVMMPGEGVLIVVGVGKEFVQPPRGFNLILLQKGEDVWGYHLQESITPTASP